MTIAQTTISITLPDGSQRRCEAPISALDIAQSIGSGLAKATVVARANGALVDTTSQIH